MMRNLWRSTEISFALWDKIIKVLWSLLYYHGKFMKMKFFKDEFQIFQFFKYGLLCLILLCIRYYCSAKVIHNIIPNFHYLP